MGTPQKELLLLLISLTGTTWKSTLSDTFHWIINRHKSQKWAVFSSKNIKNQKASKIRFWDGHSKIASRSKTLCICKFRSFGLSFCKSKSWSANCASTLHPFFLLEKCFKLENYRTEIYHHFFLGDIFRLYQSLIFAMWETPLFSEIIKLGKLKWLQWSGVGEELINSIIPNLLHKLQSLGQVKFISWWTGDQSVFENSALVDFAWFNFVRQKFPWDQSFPCIATKTLSEQRSCFPADWTIASFLEIFLAFYCQYKIIVKPFQRVHFVCSQQRTQVHIAVDSLWIIRYKL